MPNDLNTLDSNDKEIFIKLVTKNEVYSALRAMPGGKSPGPDGLNADFYMFYWSTVGDHLFQEVSHFFNTCKLPSSWGRTFVALIPKIDNPKKVDDFGLFLFATFLIKSFLKS